MTPRPGYEPLAAVLARALDQSQAGKGAQRHAVTQGVARPFLRQPICEIGRMAGAGYCIGQAMKKAHEGMELPPPRAVAELLGAIVYLAAAVILIEERAEQGGDAAKPDPRQEAYEGAMKEWRDQPEDVRAARIERLRETFLRMQAAPDLGEICGSADDFGRGTKAKRDADR
jgi:hypothetical protein